VCSSDLQNIMISGTALTPVVFHFNGAPVAPGSTITFVQTQDISGAAVDYNVLDAQCPGVQETEGTTPPLDTKRNNGVAVTITGEPVPRATGRRARALKKCKKKHSKQKRKKCKKRARKLPV